MLERLYEKVEQVAQDQSEMKVTLAGQAVQLENHVKRTQLAEENIEILRKDLKPVESHVNMVNGALKFIGILASLAAIVKIVIEIS